MHLDRLVAVLETIAIAGRPVSASELHQMSGLPRPTCYRLLQTLAEQRLLECSETDNRYVVGERLVRIALLARTDAGICGAAAPVLKAASIEFGETVFLSRLRHRGVKIIHVETPSDPTVSFMHPGLGYRPVHACSCSKAIVAFSSESDRSSLLKRSLKAYTDKTRTDPDALLAEFEVIRKRGFAECVEEIEIGVASVAAPILLADAGALFSIGTIGPIRRFGQRHRRALGKKLGAIASEVGEVIAFNGGATAT